MQQAPSTSKSKRFLGWMSAPDVLLIFEFVFLVSAGTWTLTHRSCTQGGTSDLDDALRVEAGEGQLGTASESTEGAGDPAERRLQTYPPPTCRSHGFVLWADVSPASGAEIISLETPKHGYTQNTWIHTGHLTDDEGRYELPHQESCSVRLGAVVPGKGRGEEQAAPVDEEDDLPYVIRRDIVLDDAGRLHGVVLDELGEPVQGAAVCASLS